ncbi:DNA-binding protein [Metschnikowia bicuspidata var. bicuspidata NRRL YB-4993]|uniref:DNA-binding protein n=1 Tax=Metschnikowia bicuspidata var. bicuspidata NRRL YB-4993 TaxID=869754 RepID=A0A1A0HC01_9ASCO|nr:DNA-binding protein [Metschnikowia bicuspidata var. bicuspidata NRRL YB-4993]OBA21510.1 DNA-binding protein [Metschnikowia bicuspidata var. bicuspidata NRRL YB-4993]
MTESLSKLALKGSSKIVADYFEFAIHSILFQRGIYPSEDFITVRKYDLPMLFSADDEVKAYIRKIMDQVKKWIYGGRLSKLVVVIINKATTESFERWEFSLDTSDDVDTQVSKSRADIQREIQAIIRQITASVSYLPFLKDDEYTFNVLVYTDPSYETKNIPCEWADTNGDGKMIEGDADAVQFSTFQTTMHNVGTSVSYKLG